MNNFRPIRLSKNAQAKTKLMGALYGDASLPVPSPEKKTPTRVKRVKKICWEDIEQMKLMKWICLQPALKDLTIHIPNQGKRTWNQGRQLVRMGLKAGVSDIFIALPTTRLHGLWIELKRKEKNHSKVSVDQHMFLGSMKRAGYGAEVAYGADHAIRIILDYMKDLPKAA